jgi:hypothetical protein
MRKKISGFEIAEKWKRDIGKWIEREFGIRRK